MEMLMNIPVKKTKRSGLPEVDFNHLEFGKYVSDHMLICDYDGKDVLNPGWQQAQIVPFGNLSLSPASLALHYGQTVFEGMKAIAMESGRVNIFRPDKHYDRFVRSLERMCMAIPPRDLFMEGLTKLIETDKDWVPKNPGTSLYIRPFMYASEARFGVKVSDYYRFVIFTGPVPEVYTRPIKVKVETNFIRAAKGGTGFAKCGGNYGGAFYPTRLANQEGFDQVLWTTGQEDPHIEESGMMNVMFVINDVLLTPPLSDSILDGVTRDSLLHLARKLGYKTEERSISVAELEQAFNDKLLTEAFGAGTAAVVAPIETIHIKGKDFHLPEYGSYSLHFKLKEKLESLRSGKEEDVFGWNYIV